MIAIATLPLILAIISLLLYALAANPKVAEKSDASCFFCGLLVLTFALSKDVVRIG